MIADTAIDIHLASSHTKYGRGIGDTVAGYYVACGLAETRVEVRYHNHHPEFLTRVSHPRVRVFSQGDCGPDMGGGDADYERQLEHATDRKLWYCQNLEKAGIPACNPSREFAIDREPRSHPVDGDYILLSPFSAQASRSWPAMHWARMARHFALQGVRVVAMGLEQHRKTMMTTFGCCPSLVSWTGGEWPAETLMDALLGAKAVVGNDSGIPHVAAMLGTPTVAIHSHVSPEVVFSHTDVVSVVPDASCRFCGWREDRGFGTCCRDLGCSALASIGPEKVIRAVEEMLNGNHRKNHHPAREEDAREVGYRTQSARRTGTAGSAEAERQGAGCKASTTKSTHKPSIRSPAGSASRSREQSSNRLVTT